MDKDHLPDDWQDQDLLDDRAFLDWLTAADDRACLDGATETRELPAQAPGAQAERR